MTDPSDRRASPATAGVDVTGAPASAEQSTPVLDTGMDVQMPDGLGEDPTGPVRAGLHALLLDADGQLQSVYQAQAEHPEAVTATQLLRLSTCANSGAVSNRLAAVNAVFNQQIPAGPSVARQAASSIRRLLNKAAQHNLREHLSNVLTQLDERVGDPEAERREAEELQIQSIQFERTAQERLRNSPGVYVYTYPHYWTHPYVAGTERRLLKVGKTDGAAFARIRAQVRQTGGPEDPLLLRVYLTSEPSAVERTFHRLLDAAEHHRSMGTTVGREWFNTTVEFCDAIAGALGLETVAAARPA